jgi:hypothetical protein
MLIKIGNRIINSDRIVCAELKPNPTHETVVGLWLWFDRYNQGSPELGLEGREASQVWEKLLAEAENVAP